MEPDPPVDGIEHGGAEVEDHHVVRTAHLGEDGAAGEHGRCDAGLIGAIQELPGSLERAAAADGDVHLAGGGGFEPGGGDGHGGCHAAPGRPGAGRYASRSGRYAAGAAAALATTLVQPSSANSGHCRASHTAWPCASCPIAKVGQVDCGIGADIEVMGAGAFAMIESLDGVG